MGYRWGGKGNPPVNFICLLPDWDSGGGGVRDLLGEKKGKRWWNRGKDKKKYRKYREEMTKEKNKKERQRGNKERKR